MHDNLLRGQQNIVVSDSRVQQRILDHGLILQQGLLLRKPGGADGGNHFPAFIDGLHDLKARVPILIGQLQLQRRTRQLKILNRVAFGPLVLAGGDHMGQRHGTSLDYNAIVCLQIAFGLENRGVLAQRQIQAIHERQRPGDPVGRVGGDGGVLGRRLRTGDKTGKH